MSLHVALATALRVIQQLRRDPRTLAMVLVVPCVMMWLLEEVFGSGSATFNAIAIPLLGLFPFMIMFLITSITMLRERSGGTLERLMTMPLHKVDLLGGYGIAFALLAALQAVVTSGVSYWLLGLDSAAPAVAVVGLAVANAICGVALGLLVSAFANTEFQAAQFMPAFIFPQLLLCGLFVARDEMADWLQALSSIFPMTYAYGALDQLVKHGEMTTEAWTDLVVIAGFTILALIAGSATLRRRTP